MTIEPVGDPNPPPPNIGNFRDYGGVPSGLGGHVRSDRLYRSGHVARALGADRDKLLALDFDVICDLRYELERSDQPSRWPDDYASRLLLHDGAPTADAPHVAVMKSGAFDEAGVDRFYLHYYRELTLDALYPGLFGRFLLAISASPGRSLIHCSVGKDRTGILAALVLKALGVDEDAIMADFVASNANSDIEEMTPEIAKRLREKLDQPVSAAAVRKMLQVEEDYLRVSFDTIREQYGSLDAYFSAIGFGPPHQEALRKRLIV